MNKMVVISERKCDYELQNNSIYCGMVLFWQPPLAAPHLDLGHITNTITYN